MTAMPLKSILKPAAAQVQARSRDDRNRETALYHANLIQERKNIELEILTSMEEMIELPHYRNPPYSATNPSPSDTTYFKEAIRLYQPSDYDDLIQERNINDHCGYTLCPKPRVREKGMGTGQFRIVGKTGKAKDFRVVNKEELEKWCSDDCAKRALYVRVQLSERPAWERSISTAPIELIHEKKSEKERQDERLAEDLQKLQIAADETMADLALERGDRGSRAKDGMVGVEIMEKDVTSAAVAPSFDDTALYSNLEGYNPRFGNDGTRKQSESDDEDMDTDWVL